RGMGDLRWSWEGTAPSPFLSSVATRPLRHVVRFPPPSALIVSTEERPRRTTGRDVAECGSAVRHRPGGSPGLRVRQTSPRKAPKPRGRRRGSRGMSGGVTDAAEPAEEILFEGHPALVPSIGGWLVVVLTL